LRVVTEDADRRHPPVVERGGCGGVGDDARRPFGQPHCLPPIVDERPARRLLAR
jgi:hypothetical protein